MLAGPESALNPVNGYKLWHVTHPVRLAHTTRGLTGDGWAQSPDGKQPAVVTYSQFATPGYRDGYLSVSTTRSATCIKSLPVEHAVIRVGTLTVDKDNNPIIGKLLRTVRIALKPCVDQTTLVSLPGGKGFKAPFEASISISPTYQLRQVAPRSSETRWLAAQVAFSFTGFNPSS